MKNRARKLSYLRFFIQILFEFGLFYLYTYDPMLALVVGTVLLITLVTGRFFCGWICPFGFYMDLITQFRKSVKMRYLNLPERANKGLHILRYLIIAIIFILPFLIGAIDSERWSFVSFLIGPFKPLRLLLGPLVPVAAPWESLIELNGVNLNYPYIDQVVYYSSGVFVWINALLFVVLTVVSSFIVRRFWCRFCPTGASVAIVNRFKSFSWAPLLHIDKDEKKCTKCGICKRVCPLQVTEVYERKSGKITTSMCMLCMRCVEMCPNEECLEVKVGRKTIFKSQNWLEPSPSE